MQIPKLVINLLTINFNSNDQRKIEILNGDENKGTFLLSGLRMIKGKLNNSKFKTVSSEKSGTN